MRITSWLAVIALATLLGLHGCSSSSDSGILDKDTDGDGINNNNDPDIDGDGIPNGSDDDIDGDGKPNDNDADDDGDGQRDKEDKSPEGPVGGPDPKAECADEGGTWNDTNNRCALPKGNDAKQLCLDLGGTWDDDACTPWDETAGSDRGGIPIEERCVALAVKGPSDEVIAGKITSVTWQLLPQGCSLSKDQNTKFVVEATDTRNPADDGGQTKGLKSRPGRGIQHITVPCAAGAIAGKKVNIVYDFSALAKQVLGKGTNDLAYFPSVEHPVPSKGCNLSIPNPDEGTRAECEAKPGWTWDATSGACNPPRVACETDQNALNNMTFTITGKVGRSGHVIKWENYPKGCVADEESMLSVQGCPWIVSRDKRNSTTSTFSDPAFNACKTYSVALSAGKSTGELHCPPLSQSPLFNTPVIDSNYLFCGKPWGSEWCTAQVDATGKQTTANTTFTFTLDGHNRYKDVALQWAGHDSENNQLLCVGVPAITFDSALCPNDENNATWCGIPE